MSVRTGRKSNIKIMNKHMIINLKQKIKPAPDKQKISETGLIFFTHTIVHNNSNMKELTPTERDYIQTIQQTQLANPNIECFAQIYVLGRGWRLISALTGKEYTLESYYQEYGSYPKLTRPETHPEISGKGWTCYWDSSPSKSRRRPQGFQPKKKPQKRGGGR